jgi:ABC-type transport system substrate-binding protein
VIPNRTYELLLFGNIISPPYDLFPFLQSNERFHPGLNLALYQDAQMDSLLDAIRSATDAASRERVFSQARTKLAADAPAIFLYQTPYSYLTGSDVHGVTGHLIGESADRFDEVQKWYVETEREWK